MTSDPVRLREDPAVPEWCREALLDETGASPPGFDEAAGLASLRGAIAAAGPATRPRWLVRSLGGLAVIAAFGAVVAISSSSEQRTPPPATAVPHEVPASPKAPPAPTDPGIAVESLPSAPTALPRAKPIPMPSPSAKQVESAPPPPALDPLEETRHLAALRRLAEQDPEAAIRFAAEGDRRFPRGILGEEREAIAIACLARLGRADETNRRAVRFLENYPESPFAPSVRRAAKL